MNRIISIDVFIGKCLDHALYRCVRSSYAKDLDKIPCRGLGGLRMKLKTHRYRLFSAFFRNIDISFSKYLEFMGHDFSLGLGIYNVFDIRNAVDVYALTGKADDPGTYYTNYVGLPGTDPNGAGVYADKSSAYYDRPWRFSTPREINFFVRFDFE